VQGSARSSEQCRTREGHPTLNPTTLNLKFETTPATQRRDAEGRRGGEREFFIDNLLVRMHFIIVMIRWTGLAPWEFEFPFQRNAELLKDDAVDVFLILSSSLLLSSLELSDTKVYQP